MYKRKDKEKAYQGQPPESDAQPLEEHPVPTDSSGRKAKKKDEKKELLEKLQRVTADFLNYQKRMARNAEDARLWARAEIIKTFLPAIDDFEQALEAGKNATDVPSLLKGFKLVHDHLLDMLAKQQVEAISTQGQKFDPAIHEALMQQESTEHEPGAVIAELRKGYTMNGRTLRPARVAVSCKPQTEENAENDKEDTAGQ